MIGDGQGVHIDSSFHHLLSRMAKNRVMERLSMVLMDLLSQTRDEYLQSEERRRISVKGHQRILDAIKSGNRRAARQAMRKHLADVEKIVFDKKRGGGKILAQGYSWMIDLSTQYSPHLENEFRLLSAPTNSFCNMLSLL